jgi:hypothetical protein
MEQKKYMCLLVDLHGIDCDLLKRYFIPEEEWDKLLEHVMYKCRVKERRFRKKHKDTWNSEDAAAEKHTGKMLGSNSFARCILNEVNNHLPEDSGVHLKTQREVFDDYFKCRFHHQLLRHIQETALPSDTLKYREIGRWHKHKDEDYKKATLAVGFPAGKEVKGLFILRDELMTGEEDGESDWESDNSFEDVYIP